MDTVFSYGPGKLVWVPDAELCFFPAEVVTLKQQQGVLSGEVKDETGATKRLDGLKFRKELQDVDPQSLEDMDDMDLNEPAILHNLRRRFQKDHIYTNIGDIIVSVNPFKMLPIYTKSSLNTYIKTHGFGQDPHLYNIPDRAYTRMLANRCDQAICIAGESGAGKTEAMKLVLQYLAEVSSSNNTAPAALPELKQIGGKRGSKRFSFLGGKTNLQGGLLGHNKTNSIEQQILQMNPITEAFGNAKTVRNNNSSRFGKWTEIRFNAVGNIKGARIIDYLLEKSRVAHQNEGERNFHVFFELIAGRDLLQDKWPEIAQSLALKEVSEHNYLVPQNSSADGHKVDGQEDDEEFLHLIEAFNVLLLSQDQQQNILRLLAGILHMGDLQYGENNDGGQEGSKITNREVLKLSASLFELNAAQLEKALISRQMGARSVISVPYKVDQACATRDAVCKACYGQLFSWLIEQVNVCLGGNKKSGGEKLTAIGVLDIFGFEIFKINSFEQLCINYCNEKLQCYFNNHIFVVEQRVYAEEGVTLQGIEFINNEITCELIDGSKGILSQIDEEIKIPRGSDSGFLAKAQRVHGQHPNFSRNVKLEKCFGIKHFAGEVHYNVTGLLEKNKDLIPVDITTFIESDANRDTFVQKLLTFAKSYDGTGSAPVSLSRAGSTRKVKAKATLGAKFKVQMTNLMATLQQCSPHFVRCMKPNHSHAEGQFQSPMMMHQLCCSGLLEVSRVRQAGFSSRVPFEHFFNTYWMLAPGTENYNTLIAALERKGHLSALEYQLGHTKVFMRASQNRKLQDTKARVQFDCACYLQKVARAWPQKLLYRRWLTCLRHLRIAMAEFDAHKLDQCMLAVKQQLPYGGKGLQIVRNAERERSLLDQQQQVVERLTSLDADASGLNPVEEQQAIDELIQGMQSIGLEEELVESARESILALLRKKKAAKVLQKAIRELKTNKDRNTLTVESALVEAEAAKVDEEDVKAARELVARMTNQKRCLATINACLADPDAVDREKLAKYLENANSVDISHEMSVKEAKRIYDRLQAQFEEEQRKRAEAVRRATNALVKAIKVADEALKREIVATADELLRSISPLKQALQHAVGGANIDQGNENVILAKATLSEVIEEEKKRRIAEKRAIEEAERIRRENEQKAQIQDLTLQLDQAIKAHHLDDIRRTLKRVDELKLGGYVQNVTKAKQEAKQLYDSERSCVSELKEAIRLRDLDVLQESLAKASSLKLHKRKGVQALLQKAKQAARQLENEVAREVARQKVKWCEKDAVDLKTVDIDRELWTIFTFYTVNTYAREPEAMRKDALVQVLRDCNLLTERKRAGRLIVAEVNVIHQCELSLHEERKFKYSSFCHALELISNKIYHNEKDVKVAVHNLLSIHLLPHCKKRCRNPLNIAKVPFAVPVADGEKGISYETSVTSNSASEERRVKRLCGSLYRYSRSMLTLRLQQRDAEADMSHEGTSCQANNHSNMHYFYSFAQISNCQMYSRSVKSADLAIVFLDSLELGNARSDVLGGLSYEEFWQALVRLVFRLSDCAEIIFFREQMAAMFVWMSNNVASEVGTKSAEMGSAVKEMQKLAKDLHKNKFHGADSGASQGGRGRAFSNVIDDLRAGDEMSELSVVPEVCGGSDIGSEDEEAEHEEDEEESFRSNIAVLLQLHGEEESLRTMPSTDGQASGGDIQAHGARTYRDSNIGIGLNGRALTMEEQAGVVFLKAADAFLWQIFVYYTIAGSSGGGSKYHPAGLRIESFLHMLRDCNFVIEDLSECGMRSDTGFVGIAGGHKKKTTLVTGRKRLQLDALWKSLDQHVQDTNSTLESIFVSMDRDRNGSISGSEFRNGLTQLLGRKVSTQLLDIAIRELDRDGDGQISFREFKRPFLEHARKKNGVGGTAANDAEWTLSPFGPPQQLDTLMDANLHATGTRYQQLRLKKVIAVFNICAGSAASDSLTFSSFKVAIVKLASLHYHEYDRKLGTTNPVQSFLTERLIPHAKQRLYTNVHSIIVESTSIFRLYSRCLKQIFQFYAGPAPSPDVVSGMIDAHRYQKRPDLKPEHQILQYNSFRQLCSDFKIRTGTASSTLEYRTSTELAVVFIDSIDRAAAMAEGVLVGMTFEEFWQAIVRIAKGEINCNPSSSGAVSGDLASAGQKKVSTSKISLLRGPKRSNASGDDDIIEEKLCRLFIWLGTKHHSLSTILDRHKSCSKLTETLVRQGTKDLLVLVQTAQRTLRGRDAAKQTYRDAALAAAVAATKQGSLKVVGMDGRKGSILAARVKAEIPGKIDAEEKEREQNLRDNPFAKANYYKKRKDSKHALMHMASAPGLGSNVVKASFSDYFNGSSQELNDQAKISKSLRVEATGSQERERERERTKLRIQHGKTLTPTRKSHKRVDSNLPEVMLHYKHLDKQASTKVGLVASATEIELTSSLFKATMREDTGEIDRLLNAGVDIGSKNKAGITPIQLAADRQKKKALAHFRSRGLC